ncbi:MAG: DUF5320 domain-containing protein [Tissierellia bacterium]|nr:DUF5320 domain-containing protein [Tissierellia bacterium]
MPRFDGTGPMGIGPMTGWGRGYCRPWAFGGRRRGLGYGYGFRAFGRGMGAYPTRPYPLTQEEKKAILEEERDFLKSRLKEIEEILGNLGE